MAKAIATPEYDVATMMKLSCKESAVPGAVNGTSMDRNASGRTKTAAHGHFSRKGYESSR